MRVVSVKEFEDFEAEDDDCIPTRRALDAGWLVRREPLIKFTKIGDTKAAEPAARALKLLEEYSPDDLGAYKVVDKINTANNNDGGEAIPIWALFANWEGDSKAPNPCGCVDMVLTVHGVLRDVANKTAKKSSDKNLSSEDRDTLLLQAGEIARYAVMMEGVYSAVIRSLIDCGWAERVDGGICVGNYGAIPPPEGAPISLRPEPPQY